MSRHDCIIGLLHHYEYSELVTLSQLINHIKYKRDYNESIKHDPLYHDASELYKKEWSLKQYCDKRVSTDMKQFDFCPECGKKINWKEIREKGDEL